MSPVAPDVESSAVDFRELYAEHFDFVWRNLRNLGVAAAELEDATQDTFVVAYRRQTDYRPAASMRGWLYGILRRIAYRQRRGGGRRAKLLNAIAREPQGGSDLGSPLGLERSVESQEGWRLLQRFLQGLPPPQAEVYALVEIEGLTGSEAGAALGVAPNTVASRLRTARQAFERYAQTLRARQRGLERRLRADAVRGAQPPSPAQRHRVAGLIAAQLGAPSSPWWALPALGRIELFAATVVVGVGGVVATATLVPPPSPSPTVAIASTTEPDVLSSAPPSPSPAIAQEATAELRAATPLSGSSTLAAPRPPVGSSRSLESAGRTGLAPRPSTRGTGAIGAPGAGRAPSQPDTPPDEDILVREARFVRTMRANLSTDPRGLLRHASTYLHRFPAGTLGIEVSVLRVRALCELGRGDEATRAARALDLQVPDSPVTAVAKRGCPQTASISPGSPNPSRRASATEGSGV